MSETIYEFIPGKGWVVKSIPEGGRVICWIDFMTYKYDNWVCKFCGLSPGTHQWGGDDFDGMTCVGTNTNGLFHAP